MKISKNDLNKESYISKCGDASNHWLIKNSSLKHSNLYYKNILKLTDDNTSIWVYSLKEIVCQKVNLEYPCAEIYKKLLNVKDILKFVYCMEKYIFEYFLYNLTSYWYF